MNTRRKSKIKSSIVSDSITNIFASLLLTIASQFVVYPYLALTLSNESYGNILTIMGLINTIGVSVGSSVNNTRLLLQEKYEKKSVKGDFGILFSFSTLFSIAFVSILFRQVFALPTGQIIYISLLIYLLSFKAYHSVAFRIKINYKKIMCSNIMGSLGYIVGIPISIAVNNWLYIFLTGEFFSCIYILLNASTVREKLNKTKLFRATNIKFIFIFMTALISNSMTYMDRFLVYPLLGSEYVSIYTVSSFLGKSVGILLVPISGVLLTYIVKEKQITVSLFLKRVNTYFIISGFIYLGILLLGKSITGFLYPSLIEASIKYMNIANLASLLSIVGGILQPSLMKYAESYWQLLIQISYLAIYFLAAYIGMTNAGLLGFCYAILGSNLLRLVMMISVIICSLTEKNKKATIE